MGSGLSPNDNKYIHNHHPFLIPMLRNAQKEMRGGYSTRFVGPKSAQINKWFWASPRTRTILEFICFLE
jgi:hypothetical protein